jgi:glycerol-3-phosphate acyltransferase PlsY
VTVGMQAMLGAVLAIVLSYLLGSMPIGYLYARARGVDLRKIGSGNIGATNVYRAFGKVPAIIIFCLDVAKGLAAVVFIARLGEVWQAGGPGTAVAEVGVEGAGLPGGGWEYTAVLCGLAAIGGHVTSVFMKFKGGKGVATAVGVFLGLVPLATVICLAVWAVLFGAFRYVSLGSIVGAAALPVMMWLVDRDGFKPGPVFYFALLVAAIVIVTHRANIRRLAKGKEHKIGKRREEAV